MNVHAATDDDYQIYLRRDIDLDTPSVKKIKINGSFVLDVGLLYDIKLAASKNMDDYDFYLVHCDKEQGSSCKVISKAFKQCDDDCTMGSNQFDKTFSMAARNSDKRIKVHILLSKERNMIGKTNRDFVFKM